MRTLCTHGIKVILILSAGTAAAADCVSFEGSEFQTTATSAMASWEDREQVGVMFEVKESILGDLCNAADRAVSSGKISYADVNRAATPTVTGYLDGFKSESERTKSVEAQLLSNLGVSGLSRPKPKPYGVLKVTYTQDVTHLLINTVRMERFDEYVLLPGKTRIDGINAARTVCHSEVEVRASQAVETRC